MGRLIALILGGIALVLYAPYLVLTDQGMEDYRKIYVDLLGRDFYDRLAFFGPGTLVGLALILIAVRGKD